MILKKGHEVEHKFNHQKALYVGQKAASNFAEKRLSGRP